MSQIIQYRCNICSNVKEGAQAKGLMVGLYFGATGHIEVRLLHECHIHLCASCLKEVRGLPLNAEFKEAG